MLQTELAEVESILWRSMAELWASSPPIPGGAHTLLESYFATRAASFPSGPPVDASTLAARILAGRGAAPDIDEQPHELFHPGVRFVAHLLG